MTKATRVGKAKCLEKSLLKWRELERTPAPNALGADNERKFRRAKYGETFKFCTELGLVRNLQEQQVSQTHDLVQTGKISCGFFRNISFTYPALGNPTERAPVVVYPIKRAQVTFNPKAPCH